jgi:hypothetical protein
MAAAQTPNPQNTCDRCHRVLGDCRIIIGNPLARRQFCTLACYDFSQTDSPKSDTARIGGVNL